MPHISSEASRSNLSGCGLWALGFGRELAREAGIDRKHFKDLMRKHFLVGNDGFGGGLYIWPSRKAAEEAHNEEWQAMVEKRTGSRPTFRYFDLLMLLDNEKGTVTEWPEPDRPVMIAAE